MPERFPPSLREKYIQKLKSSGLSLKEAKKLGCQLLTAEQTHKLGHKKVPCFKLPYFDLNGKQTKFYRIRYLEGTRKGLMKQTDAKDQRYDQPAKTTTEIYFPPLMKMLWAEYAKAEAPLIITEGELKAACATKNGYPAIGLGGVWCFCSRKNGIPLLPVLSTFEYTGRKVYIIFDSDAATNPQVAAAENALCQELLKLKAEPFIVRLPALGGQKTGLDDYLVQKSDGEFRALLEEAEPFKLSAELHRLNEEVIYIENPSLILRYADNYKMSVATFKNEVYADRTFIDFRGERPKTVKTAEEWIRWPGRAKANKFVYEPGQPKLIEGKFINMWQGLPYEPKKGDITPWNTLMEYVFKEDKAARKWFEQWCAYPLQNLGAKLFTAVVMWSVKTGTGKTLIGHTLQRLYGRDNSILIRKRDLTSGNNSFAENKQFALGEEITGDERRSLVDDLKTLITNEELRINIKYVPEYTIRSCINYYFTSNNPDAFFLDEADRRFFVQEIVGDPLEKSFYTQEFDPWYKSDDIAALLYYFMNIDLSGFDPRDHAPMTRAKEEMIEHSRSVLSNWVHKLRTNPSSVLRVNDKEITAKLWTTEDLLTIFDPEGKSRVGVRGMSVELKRNGFEKANGGMGCRTTKGQTRLWIVGDSRPLRGLTGGELGKLYDEERKAMTKEPKYAK